MSLPAPDVADTVRTAGELIANGHNSEACSLLQGLAGDAHASPAVFLQLAQAQQAMGAMVEAGRTLETGVNRFPADVDLHGALALARWVNGDQAGFADPFLAAVAAQPDNLALLLRCADLLRLAEQLDMAEHLLGRALKRHPEQVAIQAWLAVVLDETGRSAEALRLYDNVLRAYPGQPVLLLNRAHALMRLGRPDAALADIAQVRRGQPANQLAITYEATALRQKGDARAGWLCDYDRHVRIFDLAPPAGYRDIDAFNQALGKHLRGLQRLSAHPLEQSLRGGSQTSQNLVLRDDPVLRTYFDALDAPIRAYISDLDDDPGHPLSALRASGHRLSGCWSVLLKPGGFHVNHTHPEGWISSSYYVSLPEKMGEGADQQGWIKFGEPRWPIPGCGIERSVEPREGRLVLFPSYMWHGTIPFQSGERLTAPFDVQPAAGPAR